MYCLMCPASDKEEEPFSLLPLPKDEPIQLENQVYTLQFDSTTKLMSSIKNKVSGVEQEISHQYIAYPSQPWSGAVGSARFVSRCQWRPQSSSTQ